MHTLLLQKTYLKKIPKNNADIVCAYKKIIVVFNKIHLFLSYYDISYSMVFDLITILHLILKLIIRDGITSAVGA